MWCCLFACLIHAHFLPHNDLIKTTYVEVHFFLFLSVLIFIRFVQFYHNVRRIALYGRLNRTSTEMKRKSFKYTHESMITWKFFFSFSFFSTAPQTWYGIFLILLMEMANIYMSNFCGLKEIFFVLCVSFAYATVNFLKCWKNFCHLLTGCVYRWWKKQDLHA